MDVLIAVVRAPVCGAGAGLGTIALHQLQTVAGRHLLDPAPAPMRSAQAGFIPFLMWPPPWSTTSTPQSE